MKIAYFNIQSKLYRVKYSESWNHWPRNSLFYYVSWADKGVNQLLTNSQSSCSRLPLPSLSTSSKFWTRKKFEAFTEDRKVCVHLCFTEYLDRTSAIKENLEGNTSLILSYDYPYRPVKSATVARYVKNFLGQCGIDLTVFTAHSTRSASTSKANNMGLSVKRISIAAGWRGASTFQRFL